MEKRDMIKKLKRLILYIPAIPLFIIYIISLSILFITSTTVELCEKTTFRYALMLRKKYPSLIINDIPPFQLSLLSMQSEEPEK